MAETWPEWLTSSKHVAEAADWVRWKTKGRVMLVLAIGPGSIAMAKDRELQPRDVAQLLRDEAERIEKLAAEMHTTKQTHGAIRRL